MGLHNTVHHQQTADTVVTMMHRGAATGYPDTSGQLKGCMALLRDKWILGNKRKGLQQGNHKPVQTC